MRQQADRRIVVVGAGQAGGRVCAELRSRGSDRPIVMIGDEPVPPYERPPLSKAVLLGLAQPTDALVNPAGFYAAHDIDLLSGMRVTAIDRSNRRVVCSDGSKIVFDRLILATGLTPRRLAASGGDLPGVLYLRTASDAHELRRQITGARPRVAIVGGGPIGLEVAASARQLGLDVTVIEQTPRCLGRLMPEKSARTIERLHAERGVKIISSQGVRAVHGVQRVESLVLDSGKVIPADLVVVGVGSVANDDLARVSGLATGQGIVVDAHCRTSDPAIYAIGDVAVRLNAWCGGPTRLESWDNAESQARVVASHITDQTSCTEGIPWFWTDQYDWNVQVVGVPRAAHKPVARVIEPGRKEIHFYLDGRVPRSAVLFNAGSERRAVAAILAAGKPCPDVLLQDIGVSLKGLA
ncbi:MAG: FAD-dependent oxidoreductase [Rhodospirillaceae bacterium]|nr:FAD-dependent oxidoreductase [Rhodospirillaceae bacterium]